MGAALFTFLAEEMLMEAENIQESNNHNKRPGYHAQTIISQKEGGLDKDLYVTENKVENRNHEETHKPKYKWTNSQNSMQSQIKENTGKKGKTCFDDILVNCRGILFGRL